MRIATENPAVVLRDWAESDCESLVRHYSRTATFGYWLGQAHWGKGIATAAARALKEHALAGEHLKRLEAAVFEWNPASMRVLEKAGFVREGVLRKSVFKDGQLIDQVMYAAIAPMT